jgi:hypothetical protein
METTLHLVRLAKIIWLVRQKTLRRLMVGLVVLLGLSMAQGTRFSLGGTGDTVASASSGGVWLEVSGYSTDPERLEPWLRASFYGENDGQFLFGFRSRQDMGSAQFSLSMGFGLRDSDMKQYHQQTDLISLLFESLFLIGAVKVMRTEIGLGLDFLLDELVGLNLEAYGSGSIIGGLSYGFRGGVSLRLGR